MVKLILLSSVMLSVKIIIAQSLSLHPQNPHYLQYKGKPVVLITSTEHYGAVLNKEFDYKKYLKTLHDEGMNYTRIFTGSYVEVPGSFGIKSNTLAPEAGNFIAPWKRTEDPGLYEREIKFDLSEWNPEYFERLKSFVATAGELDILVEVTFFCATYQDGYWLRSPFNPGNNINNLPEKLNRKKSNTLENGNLAGFQKKMVEKIVTELNDFDNVFYEIQNEPWADDPQKAMRTMRTVDPQPGQGEWFRWAEKASDASLVWQKEMADVVVETEASLPKKHLIAQNYTNFKYSVDKVAANISILNFHYVWPEAVWLNYGWRLPVSFDESGAAGNSDTTYLRQAWQFMLAGGAIFNNLDYSFYVGKEDGTGVNNASGGGSHILRKQLKILRGFLESLDFVKLSPDFTVVAHAPGMEWQAISEPQKQYAIVFTGSTGAGVRLNMPEGRFNFEIISPFTGRKLKSGFLTNKTRGEIALALPEFQEMVALKIVRQQ